MLAKLSFSHSCLRFRATFVLKYSERIFVCVCSFTCQFIIHLFDFSDLYEVQENIIGQKHAYLKGYTLFVYYNTKLFRFVCIVHLFVSLWVGGGRNWRGKDLAVSVALIW